MGILNVENAFTTGLCAQHGITLKTPEPTIAEIGADLDEVYASLVAAMDPPPTEKSELAYVSQTTGD